MLTNYDLPGQPAGANAFGVSYQRTGQNDSMTPAYAVPAVADADLTVLDERAGLVLGAAGDAVPCPEHGVPGDGQRDAPL